MPCQLVPCCKYFPAESTEVDKAGEVFGFDVSLYVSHFIFLSAQLANSFSFPPVPLAGFRGDEVLAKLHQGPDLCIQLLHLEVVAVRISHQLFKVKVVCPFSFDPILYFVWFLGLDIWAQNAI